MNRRQPEPSRRPDDPKFDPVVEARKMELQSYLKEYEEIASMGSDAVKLLARIRDAAGRLERKMKEGRALRAARTLKIKNVAVAFSTSRDNLAASLTSAGFGSDQVLRQIEELSETPTFE